MLYSIYQALHVWMIWLYLVFTCFNAVSGIFGILSQEGLGFLFYAIIIAFYFMAIRKLYYDSMPYRNGSNDIAGKVINVGISNIKTGIKDQMKQKNSDGTSQSAYAKREMKGETRYQNDEESKGGSSYHHHQQDQGPSQGAATGLTASQMLGAFAVAHKANQMMQPLLNQNSS